MTVEDMAEQMQDYCAATSEELIQYYGILSPLADEGYKPSEIMSLAASLASMAISPVGTECMLEIAKGNTFIFCLLIIEGFGSAYSRWPRAVIDTRYSAQERNVLGVLSHRLDEIMRFADILEGKS